MRVFLISVLCFALSSCGSDNMTLPPPVPTGTVSGVVHDSELNSATVTVRSFANGQAGTVLGTGVTDASGNFSVKVQTEEKKLLIEATDGFYLEEATGATVNLITGQKLRAVLGYSTGASVNTSVTFLTNLAAGLAAYRVKQGTDVATAISSANHDISAVASFDINQTVPRNITNPTNVTAYASSEYSYGFLSAAISSWTAYASATSGEQQVHNTLNSISFAQKSYDDISSDGLLDGMATDGTGALAPISFGVISLNQDIYRYALAAHVISMVNSTNNKTTLTETQLLPFATAYAGNANAVFGGAVRIAFLNSGRPVVSFLTPTANQTVGGYVKVSAAASSPGTIESAVLQLVSVPAGSAPITATAPLASAPTFTIFISNANTNPNSLKATVSDSFGIFSSATLPIQIDKTPPKIVFTHGPMSSSDYIGGTYTDTGSGIKDISFSNGYKLTITPSATDPTSGTWAITFFNGWADYSMSATDNAGNVCTPSGTGMSWSVGSTTCQ